MGAGIPISHIFPERIRRSTNTPARQITLYRIHNTSRAMSHEPFVPLPGPYSVRELSDRGTQWQLEEPSVL